MHYSQACLFLDSYFWTFSNLDKK